MLLTIFLTSVVVGQTFYAQSTSLTEILSAAVTTTSTSLISSPPEQRLRNFSLDEFHGYEKIIDWLEALQMKYPSLVATEILGNSTEGRPLTIIKIGKRTGATKKIIWIDGGIHAREWMSPATAVWIIGELLANYETNAAYRTLLDTIDVHIMPVMNPDGYEFSRSHFSKRYWRKSRSQPCQEVRCQSCFGVDLNRNWAFKWNDSVFGSSDDPCDPDLYHGPRPFSEPETSAVSKHLWTNRRLIKAYISLHSFGQLLLFPFSHDRRSFTSDHDDYLKLADEMVTAIQSKHGTLYAIGRVPDLLSYVVDGSSMDWAKEIAEIKWTFTLELGTGGFAAPASSIVATAEEAWDGIMVLARRVIDTV